jgi:hypothetical protein
MDLVNVYLDTTGGSRKSRLIDPEKLLKLPDVIRRNVEDGIRKMGQDVLDDLRFGYARAIRERPRREGQHLMQRLMNALNMTVRTPQRDVWVGVFELSVIDRLTRNEGRGTQDKGWFLNLEDGRGEERKHGSKYFAFVELEWAVKLAEEAADRMKLQPTERANFLLDVGEKFKGRHGEGIMVNLEEPLFFQYPNYGHVPGDEHGRGKARNLIGRHGHPGYPALDVLEKVSRDYTKEMKEVATRALEKAAQSL